MLSMPNDSPAPRREFLGRLAGGTALLAAGTLAAACGAPSAPPAAPADEEAWLKPLTGKHKQVFDAPRVNDGFPLMFAASYMQITNETYKLQPGETSAFVVFRHFAAGLGLQDSIWKKYQLGKMLEIMDPQTKKPSERNFVWNPKPGDMMNTDASADKFVKMPGAVIGVCHFAVTVLSGMAAQQMKMKPEDALKEWEAAIIPGAFFVPSGTVAVNRAQEHGCTYCFAG